MNQEVKYNVLINNYVLERIYNVTNGALEHLEIAALLCLAGHGAINRKKSFSRKELADFCGCRERSIIKAIDRLQAKINQPDTGLYLKITRTNGAKNTYCVSTYIKKCDEDKRNDKYPPHTVYTTINSYAYNQLTNDIRNKMIAPNSVRLLCLVWRQVFGYRDENGIPHKERAMNKDYIKSISGIKYDHDIYRAQNELRDLGYFIHLTAIPFYVNGTKTTRTNYEPRTININSYRTAQASTGHPCEEATGVQRAPHHQRSEDTPTGVQRTPPTIYIKENNNKDFLYKKDGLTTVPAFNKKEENVENSVLTSETEVDNPISEAENKTDTAISAVSVFEDKKTIIAIERYKAQKLLIKLGLADEVAKLPPIEGLPDNYAVDTDQTTAVSSDDYLTRELDEILKDMDDSIADQTTPTMPSINQVSGFI